MRRVYVIPADGDPADHLADAEAAGAGELARGIPPALADRVDVDDLPTVLVVDDDGAEADPAVEKEAEALETDAAEAEDQLVELLGKLAAGGLSSSDRAAIPDLAVRALGGRAKADKLRGRRP